MCVCVYFNSRLFIITQLLELQNFKTKRRYLTILHVQIGPNYIKRKKNSRTVVIIHNGIFYIFETNFKIL